MLWVKSRALWMLVKHSPTEPNLQPYNSLFISSELKFKEKKKNPAFINQSSLNKECDLLSSDIFSVYFLLSYC
jgi:hypothetical protein